MVIPQYIVDAFTSQLFRGNPAAVCLLEHWPGDALLQNIAAENNLSETAYLVARGEDWELRWFTPQVEIALCGHATLASAFVLARLHPQRDKFCFHTKSGALRVTRDGERFILDFPSRPLAQLPGAAAITDALRLPPADVLRSGSYLLVRMSDEPSVQHYQPDFAAIRALDCNGLMLTALGTHCDFVSRFFAPRMGVNEDPVTGSAHCSLVPYWAGILGKTQLHARQLSPRGGELFCELRDHRVLMAGHAVLFGSGEIYASDTPTR